VFFESESAGPGRLCLGRTERAGRAGVPGLSVEPVHWGRACRPAPPARQARLAVLCGPVGVGQEQLAQCPDPDLRPAGGGGGGKLQRGAPTPTAIRPSTVPAVAPTGLLATRPASTAGLPLMSTGCAGPVPEAGPSPGRRRLPLRNACTKANPGSGSDRLGRFAIYQACLQSWANPDAPAARPAGRRPTARLR